MSSKYLYAYARDLPPEYYAAIGEIPQRWSWLEHQLGVMIRVVLALGKAEARVLTVGMGMKPKCHILRGLSLKLLKDRKLAVDVTQFTKAVIQQTDNRNDFVHGLWVVLPDGTLAILKMGSAEERMSPNATPAPLSDIRKKAAKLEELQHQAQSLTDRLKQIFGTKP